MMVLSVTVVLLLSLSLMMVGMVDSISTADDGAVGNSGVSAVTVVNDGGGDGRWRQYS